MDYKICVGDDKVLATAIEGTVLSVDDATFAALISGALSLVAPEGTQVA